MNREISVARWAREDSNLQPSGYCRETSELGRSHAASFDHRRRPDTLRSAMATAFFCATNTTSCLPPRVLAVRLIIDYTARTTERTRRPGCRSRDHQIARSHRSAGLEGTAISSPPQRCWALLRATVDHRLLEVCEWRFSGLSANRAGVLNAQSWRLITAWLEVRVLPAPPRTPAQTEISQFSANSPELAAIRARIVSLQSTH